MTSQQFLPSGPPAVPWQEDPVPADNRPRTGATVEFLRAGDIQRDERVNTRPVDQAWVARKKKAFDWDAIGILYVSRRGDGTHIVLDGQHRVALVCAAAGDDAEVQCVVQRGITLQREARIFELLNDARKVGAVALHRNHLTQGIPLDVAVNSVVTSEGWRVSENAAPGVLTCISRVMQIHARDLAQTPPGDECRALSDTLSTITTVWGDDPAGVHQAIVWSLGQVFLLNGTHLRNVRIPKGNQQLTGVNWLTVRLIEKHASPRQLLATAQATAKLLGRPMGKAVADTILESYNEGLPKRLHISLKPEPGQKGVVR